VQGNGRRKALHTLTVALVWREVKKENNSLIEPCCDRDSNGVGLGGITDSILLVCPSYFNNSLRYL
jgi:hypothetical protein